MRLDESRHLADLAARQAERFVAWLPLDLAIRDGWTEAFGASVLDESGRVNGRHIDNQSQYGAGTGTAV